jgi:hypothetical protein
VVGVVIIEQVTSGEAPWEEDFDYLFDDPDGRSWWDETPRDTETAAPTSTRQPEALCPKLSDRDASSQDHWDENPVSPFNPELRRGPAGANVFGASDAQLVESDAGRRPWKCSTRALAGLIALALIAAATAVILIFGGPTHPSAPQPSGSVGTPLQPGDPTGTTPVSPFAAPPPPPAPAPPPPSAEQMNPAPAPTRSWPHRTPPHTKEAQPAAPAQPPMSFAPKPVTPPQTATPGGNGHHGFF